MSEMPKGLIEVLHAAADAVVAVLADHQDWGPSGRRAGQYAFDLTADAAAVEVLHDGGLRVLSEESGADPGSGPVAVLDPVDGSTNASRGIRYYATSICVVNEGEPVAAVVHHHGTGDRYDAARGGGARLNGSKLAPRVSRPLREAIVAVNGLPPGLVGWGQFRAFGAAASRCARLLTDASTATWISPLEVSDRGTIWARCWCAQKRAWKSATP